MSLQWTLIACFLYAEVAIVLLLVLPIASPKRWNSFFKSRFLQGLANQASIYFFVLLAILVLFLLDAIREMRKYSHASETLEAHTHLDQKMQGDMRLFRAQRNFYISGFALFLCLVIRRLVSLISAQATLLAQSEAAMRQAVSASSAARSLLQSQGAGEEAAAAGNKQVSELKEKVKELEGQLAREMKDKEALKSQSENLSKEYDRLTEEYSRLQAVSEGSNDNKEE